MKDINSFRCICLYMASTNPKKVSRATSEDLKIGAAIEKREHKWASPQVAKKIAADHIKEDPTYYTGNCGGKESATVNIRIKQIRPKKKVPPPPPSNAPDWIQPNYRIWG